MAAVLAAGCGPLDRPKDRPLVVDETPLGTPRGEVKRWHEDHDWCVQRRWDHTDEYTLCNDPLVGGRQHEGPIRSFFRFEGDRLVASAVYAPVACKSSGCTSPIQVQTSLEGPPFVIFDEGLTASSVDAGREAPPDVELSKEVHDLVAALRQELEGRFGPPAWINERKTAMVWQAEARKIGLFVSADARWVVEAHQKE